MQAASAHVNEYDVDLFGEYTFLQPVCASSTVGTADCAYVALLNDLATQKLLHAVAPDAVAPRSWTLCSAEANGMLLADTPMSTLPELADILEAETLDGTRSEEVHTLTLDNNLPLTKLNFIHAKVRVPRACVVGRSQRLGH